ncbi:hypothetical protein [Rossellomorea marisflavi]|jgi:hypothetical protein
MSISKIRSALYKTAKILGDISAVLKGPKAMKRRVKNRVVGKYAAKRIFK